jgi:two-component system C4-dicarboxylate transport response regulator DctD
MSSPTMTGPELPPPAADESAGAMPVLDLRSRLLAYERALIAEALEESGGNQRQAARRLGILPTTLHEKIKRLGLRPRTTPEPEA